MKINFAVQKYTLKKGKAVFGLSNPEILLILVVAPIGMHLIFVFYFWLRSWNFTTETKPEGELRPISIIIAAKNEAENLHDNLQYFLNQDYPNYEVVVVNDGSYDSTPLILEQLQTHYAHLRVSEVPENERYKRGKKFALFCGIKASKNEFLVFSDADCRPASQNWLREMNKGFDGGKRIVLGYGAYKKQKNLLNLLIQFDTVLTALNYFSFTIAGIPYMGVGRNMGYTKSLFFEQKGYSKHIHHPSGDDDLFVNMAATDSNVGLVLSKNSLTLSKPKEDFNHWMRQKRRHASTSKLYKSSHKFLLGWGTASWYFGFLMFVFVFPFLLLKEQNIQFSMIVLGTFLVAFILRWISMGRMAQKVGEKRILYAFPLLEFIFPLLHVYFTLDGWFSKKTDW